MWGTDMTTTVTVSEGAASSSLITAQPCIDGQARDPI